MNDRIYVYKTLFIPKTVTPKMCNRLIRMKSKVTIKNLEY